MAFGTVYIIEGEREGKRSFEVVDVAGRNLLPKYDNAAFNIAEKEAQKRGLKNLGGEICYIPYDNERKRIETIRVAKDFVKHEQQSLLKRFRGWAYQDLGQLVEDYM